MFLINSKNVKVLPAIAVINIQSLLQTFYLSLVILVKINFDFDTFFSRDATYGLLGWASFEYLSFSILVVAPFAGVLGTGSIVFMLVFFTPHATGNIYLAESITGQAFGILLGMDNFPGIITFIGIAGMIIGIALSIKGDQLRKQSQIDKENTKKRDHVFELSSSISFL